MNINDLYIFDTDDALLICKNDQEQEIKKITAWVIDSLYYFNLQNDKSKISEVFQHCNQICNYKTLLKSLINDLK